MFIILLELSSVVVRMCTAPPSYTGACPKMFDFNGYTAKDLSVWSNTCKVFKKKQKEIKCSTGQVALSE